MKPTAWQAACFWGMILFPVLLFGGFFLELQTDAWGMTEGWQQICLVAWGALYGMAVRSLR